MTSPTRAFEIKYKAAKNGENQLPPQWSVPFDTEYRDVVEPNLPILAYPALLSLGWHVLKQQMLYVPAYKVVDKVNLNTNNKEVLNEWSKKIINNLYVINRATGVGTILSASINEYEAVVSWFCREPDNFGYVLCLDKATGTSEWYVEEKRKDLLIGTDSEGREVSIDEAHNITGYLLDKHSNAILCRS